MGLQTLPIEVSMIVRENEDHGEFGVMLSDRDDFEPGFGMTGAHDVLEHIDDDPTLNGEARAFGAVLWIRGLSMWFRYNNPYNPSPAYNMAGEAADFLLKEWAHEGESSLKYPEQKQDISKSPSAQYAVENLDEMGRLLKENLVMEMDSYFDEGEEDPAEHFDEWVEMWIEQMKIGYLRTEAFYTEQGFCATDVSQMFDSIKTAIQNLLKDVEQELDITVHLDWSTLSCKITRDGLTDCPRCDQINMYDPEDNFCGDCGYLEEEEEEEEDDDDEDEY